MKRHHPSEIEDLFGDLTKPPLKDVYEELIGKKKTPPKKDEEPKWPNVRIKK